MIEPSLQIGGGNWANKSDSLLGYHKDGANFYADELTFSRNSLGSYTDANGLIQSMPYNLLTYSEQFENAAWTKNELTITANNATSPNGIQNADTALETTTNAYHDILNTSTSLTLNTNYTLSEYIYLFISDGIAAAAVKFNVQTGVVLGTALGTVVSSKIENFGNGWYRCSMVYTASVSVTGTIAISTTNSPALSLATYAGDVTKGISVWGAQLNIGSTALPYFATTTRLNLARVDYKDNINGSLLLESQRTNNVTYSEQLNNAAWPLVNAGSASAPIVTANYGISPDGTQNAERVQFSRTGTTASDYSLLDRSTISTAAGVVSFYGKSLSGTQSILLYYGTVGQVFTLTTEWQRFSLYSPTTTTDLTIGTRGGAGYYYTGGSLTIDCLLWGFQKEAGSYPTSYIKSEGAATTRLADSCSKTGISDKIGQTEGTIYAEINFDLTVTASGDTRFQLSDGTGFNWIFLGIPDGSYFNRVRMYTNGPSGEMSAFSSNSLTSGVNKIAFGYKSGSFVLYINGTQAASSSSTITVPACSRVDLQGNGPTLPSATERTNYNQVQLYKTRLTNAELATLTTL
jgi:hypothetical protein